MDYWTGLPETKWPQNTNCGVYISVPRGPLSYNPSMTLEVHITKQIYNQLVTKIQLREPGAPECLGLQGQFLTFSHW